MLNLKSNLSHDLALSYLGNLGLNLGSIFTFQLCTFAFQNVIFLLQNEPD